MPNLGQVGNDTITHIVSILALLAGLVSVNAFEFVYGISTFGTTGLFFVTVQNSVFAVCMAYYAIKFAITPTGANVTTEPK